MDVFLRIVLVFPTVVFSVLLTVAIVYWLLAVSGLIDTDSIDGLLSPDAHGAGLEQVAGLLMKFGLGGVPISLIITVLAFSSWLLSYFADYLLLSHLPGGLIRFALGTGVLIGAFLIAVPVTSFLLRPLRSLFVKLRPASLRSVIGQVATVRSATVSSSQGTASLEDGGAGLILQVRTDLPSGHTRGERVVLIEYIADRHVYRVIAENEFRGE